MARKVRLSRKSIIFTLVILLIVGVAIYNKQSSKHSVVKQPQPTPSVDKDVGQSNSNTGEKNINSSTSNNQGTGTDNNGDVSGSSASQWTQSSSGQITVKLPAQNSMIKSGFELGGSAKVNKVQFRLTDNSRGVISQGFINVVNGNFSANIGFRSSGNSGRLDVFSTNSAGAEINEVQIAVRF